MVALLAGGTAYMPVHLQSYNRQRNSQFNGICRVRGPNSKNAAITINGGTFKTSDNCVLGFSGNDTAGGNTLTVNGGNFVGNITTAHYIACGIYVPNDDTVVVNGGEFPYQRRRRNCGARRQYNGKGRNI